MRMILGALMAALSVSAAPVDDIGALSVQNGVVVGASGQPANLRGMSFFWNIAPEAKDYYNANVVNWLADDWHVNLVRAAMAVEDNWGTGQEGYEYQPDRNKTMVTTVVNAAIAKGIYVIIDWHSHWSADQSNPQRETKAIAFFQEMATTYGSYPNVIYEIYNEPGFGEGDWAKIKSYHEAVVGAIRAIDPDNLIIIGTPQYSSAVDVATATPISYTTNIAYSFHFYASDPSHDSYRAKAETALARGYALFVSEWGVSFASGSGSLDNTRIQGWLDWMTSKGISWAAWSICNKSESSASLYTSASTAGSWNASDLSAAGTWYKSTLSTLNPAWTATGTPVLPSEHGAAGLVFSTAPGALSIEIPAGRYDRLLVVGLDGRVLVHSLLGAPETHLSFRIPSGAAVVTLSGPAGLRVQRSVLVP